MNLYQLIATFGISAIAFWVGQFIGHGKGVNDEQLRHQNEMMSDPKYWEFEEQRLFGEMDRRLAKIKKG